MQSLINSARLGETFQFLVGIDSVSKEEGEIFLEIKKVLEDLGARTFIDDAGDKIGSGTGNLLGKFKGTTNAPPLMLNAHMDTVEPGRGIKPVFADGIFTSGGDTILGADDKSAIAIIFEVIRVLKENNIPYSPLEIIFTVCEEVGLLGAKNFNFSLISAKYGYSLDSAETEGLVTNAPAANRLKFVIYGKDAHAGASPEKGINAIWLASKAIAGLDMGRIDDETTCNIGTIQGGTATNIVPGIVTVEGEIRSHDQKKLDHITEIMVSSFKNTIKKYTDQSIDKNLPRLKYYVEKDFPLNNIPHDHRVVTLAMEAGKNLGKKIILKKTGGGSDANIFFEKGIMTGVLGTGMQDVHTVRENIRLADMVSSAELLLEIIKLHS
ncbi:MAG TPA: peptidase T [Desulfobacteraceae bacterium]|nr:peptidase T [Desulfobacteraceae bacterium]